MKDTRKTRGAEVSRPDAAQPPASFARALLDFWNGRADAPEWFTDALVDAVAQMAAHFDLPDPFHEPDEKDQIEPLERLCERAGQQFSLRDLPYTLAHLPAYPSEIEANRTYYQQEADLLIQLMDLETDHVRPLLDVKPEGILNDEPSPNILWQAIQDHIDALFQGILHNYGVDFLRTFYPDLRLYYDKQMLRNHKSSEA